jgi:cardiolipin synthase A/B
MSMRLCLQLFIFAALLGCTTLPEMRPRLEGAALAGQKPTLVGPLPKARAEAVLARLRARGGDLLDRHLALEEEIAGTPLTLGNAARLLNDGPETYAAIEEAIRAARDHVNVEFYIIEDDEVGQWFADLLLRKAAEGVAVSLIYDSVGCIGTPRAYFDRLREGGVRVLEYNPVNPARARGAWRVNNRNHRKVVIVDGTIGFTGGINISEVYSSGSTPGARSRDEARRSGWRDSKVRIEGPAVADMQRVFLDAWARQSGEALPARNWYPAQTSMRGRHPVRIMASGPGDEFPAIYGSLLSAIAHSDKTVHITMAYFVPDPQTLEVLKDAARRGVDVRLVLPSQSDLWIVFHAGRSHYAELLEAGVRIHERQEALLHAKTIVIDGVWSTVGSSNIDWRSFLHNYELNAVILGPEFGRQMESAFERDLAKSVAIESEAWARRSVRHRVLELFGRMWEYWL